MPTKILVVDDEADLRDILRAALRDRGFEVDTADGCGPAERILEAQEYDIVLTDKNMPDSRGLEEGGMRLLRTIKERWPRTEVIMMTGYATVATAVEAMKLGAFDYLIKPFTLSALNDKIDRLAAYRGFIDSDGALATYRLLHRQVLMLIENRVNLPEADIERQLNIVGGRIDHLFGAQKAWERVIRLQNDALERIEALAEQAKAVTNKEAHASFLLDEILDVARDRFVPSSQPMT